MKVQCTRLARRQLFEAAAYIAGDRPEAASRWLSGMRDAVGRLEACPESGRIAVDLGRSDLRELLYGGYRVVYRIEPRFVRVVALRHLRRAPEPDEIGDP